MSERNIFVGVELNAAPKTLDEMIDHAILSTKFNSTYEEMRKEIRLRMLNYIAHKISVHTLLGTEEVATAMHDLFAELKK